MRSYIVQYLNSSNEVIEEEHSYSYSAVDSFMGFSLPIGTEHVRVKASSDDFWIRFQIDHE